MSYKYLFPFLTIFAVICLPLSSVQAQGYDGLIAAPSGGSSSAPGDVSGYISPNVDKNVRDMYDKGMDTYNKMNFKNPSGVSQKDMIEYIDALKQRGELNSGRELTQKEILKKAREKRSRDIAEQNYARNKQQAAELQAKTNEKIRKHREQREALLRQGK